MDKPFQKIELKKGIVVEFFNHGNRYFGDFHRVKISVLVTLPLSKVALAEDLQGFATGYPDYICYEKTLERMGVTTHLVETVRQGLIDDFLKTVAGYLKKNGFAESLLRREMQKKAK